jgi:hypothetical protein
MLRLYQTPRTGAHYASVGAGLQEVEKGLRRRRVGGEGDFLGVAHGKQFGKVRLVRPWNCGVSEEYDSLNSVVGCNLAYLPVAPGRAMLQEFDPQPGLLLDDCACASCSQ